MKRNVSILWVDDDPLRRQDAQYLQHVRPNLKAHFLPPNELETWLVGHETPSQRTPDLFLVDYYLNQMVGQGAQKYPHFGLTAAAQIREKYPEHPVYLVTQMETHGESADLDKWTQAAGASFDRILTLKMVQRDGSNILYYDALDYRLIRESERLDSSRLIEIIKAPLAAQEEIALVFPDGFRKEPAPSSDRKNEGANAIAFAKWLRDVLLSTPGFLYNSLYASTYLGMKVDSFMGIAGRLKRAKYAGVFAKTSHDMWWVSELNNILFSSPRAHRIGTTNTQTLAPVLFGIPDEDKAKCAVCGGPLPESVGINLEDDADLRPVHYRCSEPHPRKRRELYFDEPRAFEISG